MTLKTHWPTTRSYITDPSMLCSPRWVAYFNLSGMKYTSYSQETAKERTCILKDTNYNGGWMCYIENREIK